MTNAPIAGRSPTVLNDETAARRAVHAAMSALDNAHIKGDGAAVAWETIEYAHFAESLTMARRAIVDTLRRQYRRKRLEPGVPYETHTEIVDCLLMSALQAWLSGGTALTIHPYSASSYTWLAVVAWFAKNEMLANLD